MDLTKTLTFDEKYLEKESTLNSIEYVLKTSYDYLPKSTVEITKSSDKIIAHVTVDDDETIILNNIEFENANDLQIKINANTKAEDVVTLSINDKYTEGEFMTHMKNNGYTCN